MNENLGKYFRTKKRYWFILALNDNVDPATIVQEKVNCIICSRNIKTVISHIEKSRGTEAQRPFIVIKTVNFVPPSSQCPLKNVLHIVPVLSNAWNGITKFMTGKIQPGEYNEETRAMIEDFISNPSN